VLRTADIDRTSEVSCPLLNRSQAPNSVDRLSTQWLGA